MNSVTVSIVALGAVLLVMFVEMLVSRGHERTLRAQGAIEPQNDVYRTMQWVYPGSFVVMSLEGALRDVPPAQAVVAGIVLMVLSKTLKFWAIWTLGSRWTFRVLVPPAAPRIRRGPYRVLSHPNYAAVLGELPAFALIVTAPLTGALSTLWFGWLIRRRIRVEEQALRTPAG